MMLSLDDPRVLRFIEAAGAQPGALADAEAIVRGGSLREFHRIALPSGPAILIRYDASKAENTLYAALAKALAGMGVPVPRLLAHDDVLALMLMEDAGRTDLWSLRDEPDDIRFDHYARVLEAVHRLHSRAPGAPELAGIALMPGFDEALYTWEQDYFRDNCLHGTLAGRIPLPTDRADALRTELDALRARLLRLPTQLVHRDFQSQNILMPGGRPVFIDFQGMRGGTAFYDLGSLLFDPYVAFSDTLRARLLEYARSLGGPLADAPEAFAQAFSDASAQRLMQALGAYGFLGIKRGITPFLAHTAPALRNLAAATRANPHLRTLHAIATEAAGKG